MIIGRYKILKNYITACDKKHILNELKKNISAGKKLSITPLASYTLALANTDNKLAEVLGRYSYLLPDSRWIKLSLKFLYGVNLKETITGTDLMLSVCGLARIKHYNVSLYGTTGGTLNILQVKLEKLFPGIKIVYREASKFRKLTFTEKEKLVGNIHLFKTDILFVALGSPLQEIFSADLLFEKPNLNKPVVIIPVGAAFDFISGGKPQAPRFLQNAGFEWLFRLLCEPKRLWKRYLIYGPYYLVLIIRQKFFMKVICL